MDFTDTNVEEKSFVFVGIIRLVLMNKKASNGFYYKNYVTKRLLHDMEIPYFWGTGRQRGRGFTALAQDIKRNSVPFLRKSVVPAAKRVDADLLEFAVPEIADIVTCRKKFQTAATSAGRKTLRNQLGIDSKKWTAGRVNVTKCAKPTSQSRRNIFTNTPHESCQIISGTNLL